MVVLAKLVCAGVTFQATSGQGKWASLAGAVAASFIPDGVGWLIRRLHWGPRRVAVLAAVILFFDGCDAAFARTLGHRVPARVRHLFGRAPGGGRVRAGVGHALATSAAALSAAGVLIAVPATAAGGSPFAAGSSGSGSAASPVIDAVRSPTGIRGAARLAVGQRATLRIRIAHAGTIVHAIAATG